MPKLRILIIEDDEDHAFLEEDILNDELDCEITIIPDRATISVEKIKNADVILLDYNLPDATGEEILSEIRKESEAPVIIITGDEHLDTAVKTLKQGATDFLVKSPQNIALLPTIVNRVYDEHQNRNLLEKQKKEKEMLTTKIETLRQVLTTLAHYINNSTTTIFGYAQLCLQEPEDSRRCEKLSKISVKETKKITFVLQELENFVNSMEIRTTNYVNIPDAMFAIEESIKKKMEDLT
ncbi:MAG: response regulator [Calditrichaceae bacterium]|nr:response regulator [Calditrichaceae bacterium]MBN2707559.1 response regulator [Calditrichaceae bacterium]RQV95644.1 MAG: response regulator [Calditrichota bacterium]